MPDAMQRRNELKNLDYQNLPMFSLNLHFTTGFSFGSLFTIWTIPTQIKILFSLLIGADAFTKTLYFYTSYRY